MNCANVLNCMFVMGCSGLTCYTPSLCGAQIDAAGGPNSGVLDKALAVVNCLPTVVDVCASSCQ